MARLTTTFIFRILLTGFAGWLAGCTPPADTPATRENTQSLSEQPVIAASDPRITIMGRYQTLPEGGVRLGYAGVTLRFNTTASQLYLQAQSTGSNYLEIRIDDQPPTLVEVTATETDIRIEPGPGGQLREVSVMHRGETWHGLVSLTGIVLADGELLAPPPLPTRRLMILGDSVTCGTAVDRNPECKEDRRWWNLTHSYGMLLGKALDAQVHLVCYGGRGLVRSWDGRTDELNLPDFFELAVADAETAPGWDHHRYQPDLIISAIGTNDFTQGVPDQENYIATYTRLVERLVSVHPEARVALTEGAILHSEQKDTLQAWLQEVVKTSGGRASFIPSVHYPGDDCDAHPNREQHAAMAADLEAEIRQLMGW